MSSSILKNNKMQHQINCSMASKNKRKISFNHDANCKKRKINPVRKQPPITQEIIKNMLSFIDFKDMRQYEPYVNVSKSWSAVCRQLIDFQFREKIKQASRILFKNYAHLSNHQKSKEIDELFKQNKTREVVEKTKMFVPMKKCIFDIQQPTVYYFQNLFEYMMLQYESTIRIQTSAIGLYTKINYSHHLNQFVKSVMDQQKHENVSQLIDVILENYNPIFVSLRLHQIEIIKDLKNPKLLFHKNLECLNLCTTPSEIATCFRNFGFYYMQTDQLEKSLACTLKSLQFDCRSSCLSQMKYIIERCQIVIDVLKSEDHESLNEIEKIQTIQNYTRHILSRIVDFVCERQVIKLNKQMKKLFSLNDIPYIINYEESPSDRIPSITPIFTGNYYDHSVEFPSDFGHTKNKKIIEYVEESQERANAFSFDEIDIQIINQILETCEPLERHKSQGFCYKKLDYNDNLMHYYDILIKMCREDETKKALQIYSSKLNQSYQKRDYHEMKKIDLLWGDQKDGFLTSGSLRLNYDILAKSHRNSIKKSTIYYIHLMEQCTLNQKSINLDSSEKYQSFPCKS